MVKLPQLKEYMTHVVVMQIDLCLHTNTVGGNWISSAAVKALKNDIKTPNINISFQNHWPWLLIIHRAQWMSCKSLPALHLLTTLFSVWVLIVKLIRITLFAEVQVHKEFAVGRSQKSDNNSNKQKT